MAEKGKKTTKSSKVKSAFQIIICGVFAAFTATVLGLFAPAIVNELGKRTVTDFVLVGPSIATSLPFAISGIICGWFLEIGRAHV